VAPEPGSVADDEVRTWVERLAVFVSSQYGITLVSARLLGYLMICDPPEQSAVQISDAIGAKRTSLGTSLRFLMAVGFVRRDKQPGDPLARYRIDNDAWMAVMRRRLAALVTFRDIAQDGIQMVGPADPRSERMRAARDSFDWLDAVVTDAERPQPEPGRPTPDDTPDLSGWTGRASNI
jgi:predicted transcriptional regulator